MISFSVIIGESIKGALRVYLEYWWFFSFFVMWPMFHYFWTVYVQEKNIRNIKWHLLEIRVPSGVEIRPKTMEEFFTALSSGLDAAIDTLYDVYIDGVVESWFSFEIVSFEGDVHFYIRVMDGDLPFIKSHIYAQYPDAEIQEAEEYVTSIPDDIPNEDYDIWGTDMKLSKDNAYPIRTYKEFEDIASGEFIDPLSVIVEGVNALGPGEQFWIQILVRPTSEEWKKSAQNVVLKLAGRAIPEPKPGFWSEMISSAAKGISGFFSTGEAAPAEKKSNDLPSMMLHLSSGERAVIDAIDEKLKRPGFETDIRYIYAAKRSSFNKAKANAQFFAYFTQFGSDLMNSIRPDSRTKTSAYYFFPDARKKVKKRAILRKYKDRTLDFKSYIMTSDELATLYHFPTKEVRGSLVPKVEAKKGKPPATLPI